MESSELILHNNRDEWLKGRSSSIGSSDSATILGYGYASQSLYSCWAEKCRGYTPEQAASTLKVFEKGHAAEPYIARLCEIEKGWKVQFDAPYSYRRSLAIPYVTASLDAWAVIDGVPTVLEFKNTSSWAARDWNPAEGKAPLKYTLQVQHQLLVTGWTQGYLGAINGYDLKLVKVERHDSFIDMLKERYAEFWQYVESGREPPADHTEPTRKAMRFTHPPRSEPVHLGEDASAMLSRLLELEEQVEASTKEMEKVRNQLTAATKGADLLVTSDGAWYTFKGIRGGKRRLKRKRRVKV